MQLAITARRADRLEQVADQIAATGSARPFIVVADLTTPEGPAEVARQVVAALGQVDILVNDAGGSRPFCIDASEGDWEESFLVNFTGTRRLTSALLPAMRQRRWGRIINTGGSMEPRSMNGAVAAKAALHLWAKGLSCDLAKEGITVNTVVPGRIKERADPEQAAADRCGPSGFHQTPHPHRLSGGTGGYRAAGGFPGLAAGFLHHWRGDSGRWRHAFLRPLSVATASARIAGQRRKPSFRPM